MSYQNVADVLVAHILALPEFARIAALLPDMDLDAATLSEIIGAAAALAEGEFVPVNTTADREGIHLVDGRVTLSAGHHTSWRAFVEGGWTALEAPVAHGGMGLPMLVHSACEELFNRASPALGMLPTPLRCAARVLEKYGDAAMKAEWLPRLVSGEWAATICISEADAGSDVPRLRTSAQQEADGSWRVTGEKMWITFGDHDLTTRIGHMVLARTPDTAGLSLFLVPNTIDGARNGVVTRRVEEKLGLHGSPTCALGFEQAQGQLIGTLGRGLPQLFTMIIGMRLSVGSQGAGIAGAATGLAWTYAAERRQGGRPDSPPVTIDNHGDVRRQLLGMAARAEVSRGLVLLASAISDLQARETDADAKARAADLLAWLLPITKNFCAEAAFQCASEAIQVLGGAGYTREWPAEQYLRDARVLAIYEGTSGMQALDLTMRRTLGDEGRAFRTFVACAQADLEQTQPSKAATNLARLLTLVKDAAASLERPSAEIVAYPFLQLASLATTGWIALRLTTLGGTPIHDHLSALGRHWLRLALPLAEAEAAKVAMKADLVAEFAAMDRNALA